MLAIPRVMLRIKITVVAIRAILALLGFTVNLPSYNKSMVWLSYIQKVCLLLGYERQTALIVYVKKLLNSPKDNLDFPCLRFIKSTGVSFTSRLRSEACLTVSICISYVVLWRLLMASFKNAVE